MGSEVEVEKRSKSSADSDLINDASSGSDLTEGGDSDAEWVEPDSSDVDEGTEVEGVVGERSKDDDGGGGSQ